MWRDAQASSLAAEAATAKKNEIALGARLSSAEGALVLKQSVLKETEAALAAARADHAEAATALAELKEVLGEAEREIMWKDAQYSTLSGEKTTAETRLAATTARVSAAVILACEGIAERRTEKAPRICSAGGARRWGARARPRHVGACDGPAFGAPPRVARLVWSSGSVSLSLSVRLDGSVRRAVVKNRGAGSPGRPSADRRGGREPHARTWSSDRHRCYTAAVYCA